MRKFFLGLLPIAWPVLLFFIVVGAHWAAFDRFGSDIPNWDQWDAEGLNLLAPWFEHDHFVAHLFQPHNEHRVVVTKLQNLVLTLANGQWDARLESVFNATLHAALAVAFWIAGWRWLAGSKRRTVLLALLFAALAALFAAPVAWQNILGGFHSQQYWLLLFSFAAMVLLPFASPWGARWWAGALAAGVALLTMGSGFFAALVVFGLVALRLAKGAITFRGAWPTVVLTLALVAIGWVTRVEVDYHQALKAKNAQDFFLSILHSLQWPAPRAYSSLAAVLWLPWLLVAWRALRAKTESRDALAIVALGGWVLAQIIATAYARGVGGDYPASRYMDTLAFGTAANVLALAWLLARPTTSRALTFVRATFGVAWLGVFAWGVTDLGRLAIMVEMPDVKRFYVKAEAHMRGYLATNDPAQLDFPDIPYPGAASLIERLNHASLAALLPVSIRAPLALRPANASAAFVANFATPLHLNTAPRRGLSSNIGALVSIPSWGSFNERGPAATGTWTSAPLTSPLGAWLKFEVAGDLGREGVTLELRDAATHSFLTAIRPEKIPGNTWRAVYVPAPRAPFVVVARDESTQHWLAFGAPVEMGSLSYLAWQCAKNGWLVFQIAVGTTTLLGFTALTLRRTGRPTSA
jgi:hypothetical protein